MERLVVVRCLFELAWVICICRSIYFNMLLSQWHTKKEIESGVLMCVFFLFNYDNYFKVDYNSVQIKGFDAYVKD